MVETSADDIIANAANVDIAFLVVGDPFGATTHSDLMLRAKKKRIQVNIVHNASIMNAVGCCGLQLYNYGIAVSIVFFTENWRPDSFYDKLKANRDRGLHTLCLLGEMSILILLLEVSSIWLLNKSTSLYYSSNSILQHSDIRMKEQSVENLARGKKVYEPPQFMTIKTCIKQLLEIENIRKGKGKRFYIMPVNPMN